jgi:hypothetical protein
VVSKYISSGLSREAVPLAVANYGDNPTKVSLEPFLILSPTYITSMVSGVCIFIRCFEFTVMTHEVPNQVQNGEAKKEKEEKFSINISFFTLGSHSTESNLIPIIQLLH